MAKKTADKKTVGDSVLAAEGVQSPAGEEKKADVSAVEQKMVDFAEDLGGLLGSAEKKASEWLSQRQTVAEQLTRIRDTANELLNKLTGVGANMADAVQRGRRRGRPPGSVNKTAKRGPGRPKGSGKGKRRMSADARARIAAAQKARWAKIRGEK